MLAVDPNLLAKSPIAQSSGSATASPWICCQIGGREHYAVPRALYRHGALKQMITDAWVRPGNPLGLLSAGLKARFHRRTWGGGSLRAGCPQHGVRTASQTCGAGGLAIGHGAESLVSAGCVVETVANRCRRARADPDELQLCGGRAVRIRPPQGMADRARADRSRPCRRGDRRRVARRRAANGQ